jgi:hypothetical protein
MSHLIGCEFESSLSVLSPRSSRSTPAIREDRSLILPSFVLSAFASSSLSVALRPYVLLAAVATTSPIATSSLNTVWCAGT